MARRLAQLKPRLAVANLSVASPMQEAKENRQQTRALHTWSKEWRRLRLSVLVRDGFCCVLCGYVDESNEVDHIDGNAWNNEIGNLRTLCKRCHSKHGRQGNSQPIERKYTLV